MRDDQYTVDIPMCTFNHEKFIGQAIEGVLKQKTDFKYRLIIGDDCSTDGTRSIVEKYQYKYPERIKTISQDRNIGAHENSKVLFAACTARYISLCDGDDYWTDPYKLQKQVDFLERNRDFVCHCHNAEVWQDGALVSIYNSLSEPKELTRRDVISNFGIPTASVTFRNVLDKMRDYYLLKFSIDIILYFSLAKFGNFYMSDEFMSVYRLHHGGMWSGQGPQMKDQKLIDLQNHILKNLPLTENEQNDIYGIIMSVKQRRIKEYSKKFHFGFTYFSDVFYIIGAKLKGRNVNLNYLLYLMCPEPITSIFINAKKKIIN